MQDHASLSPHLTTPKSTSTSGWRLSRQLALSLLDANSSEGSRVHPISRVSSASPKYVGSPRSPSCFLESMWNPPRTLSSHMSIVGKLKQE